MCDSSLFAAKKKKKSQLLGLGGFKVCSDNSSSFFFAACNQIFEQSDPTSWLPRLCVSFFQHTLYPGVTRFKSPVHIWDSPSAVCRDLTPCGNLTPMPSFHISHPQRIAPALVGSGGRLQAVRGEACASQKKGWQKGSCLEMLKEIFWWFCQLQNYTLCELRATCSVLAKAPACVWVRDRELTTRFLSGACLL